MSIITSDKVPLVEDNAPFLTSIHKGQAEIHPLLGLAEDLYRCLKSINQLAVQRSNRNDSADNDLSLASRAETIETYLREWSTPDVDDTSWTLREAVSAAHAVRWGCSIWLQHVRHNNTQNTQEALDKILSAVSLIRPGSMFDVQLLFPLFMAGVSATLKSERLRIEYRLSILEGNIGTGNIAGAHKLLDAVWKQKNQGNQSVDWELILQQEYSGVVLQ